MDWPSFAQIFAIGMLALLAWIAYLFYAFFSKLLRAVARTTLKTIAVLTGKPYTKR